MAFTLYFNFKLLFQVDSTNCTCRKCLLKGLCQAILSKFCKHIISQKQIQKLCGEEGMVTRIEFHLKYSVATKYVCYAYMHQQTCSSLMIVKCHVHKKAKVRSVLAELLM